MSGDFVSLAGRRAPVPPSPLHAEIVRGAVLDTLSGRFDVPITTVVAGAGFGKTTALGQAIRSNLASPRGIDRWVACEPGDEDEHRLAAALLASTGTRARGRGSVVGRLFDVLNESSPVDVCIVIDDVHELPPTSAGWQLVADLAAGLPAHGHLVLASREPITIPLARRRAAGQVVAIDGDSLAFTASEVAALADALGEDATDCDGLAGWPSLVRLTLSAPPGATKQFLWEEIVASLAPPERDGLLGLAVLGSGTQAELVDIAGAPFDIDRILDSVPLVHRTDNGRFGAHRLWEDAASRIFPTSSVEQARARALTTLRDRGDTVRLGSAAVRWQDAAMFRGACVRLVRESLGTLSTDTAERWLAAVPPDAVASPEHRLLEMSLRHARQRRLGELDDELDALEAEFVAAGDNDAQAVALALACVVAHTRGDNTRLVSLYERIRDLPGTRHEPVLQYLVDAVDAALASLAGRIDDSLRILESMPPIDMPQLVVELVIRLHVVMLELAGRGDEAVDVGLPLLDSPHAYVRAMPATARWFAGDPTPFLTSPPEADSSADVNHRDRFTRAARHLFIASSRGDLAASAQLHRQVRELQHSDRDPRDSAIGALAHACWHITNHDESAARAAIADHLDRHPPRGALGLAHLRRHLAVAYAGDERVRRCLDRLDLGPVHDRARQAARQLLDARAGLLDAAHTVASPSVVLTSMPLPWSVELAVTAAHAECTGGEELLSALSDWFPEATRREVDWLAAHGTDACRAAAREAAHRLPGDDLQLAVDVLGPMRLRVQGEDVSGAELRRGRVRGLLALLAVRGETRRERLCDVLWPELDAAASARNLRVTLSRLRRLLESVHPRGICASWLVVSAETVALAPTPRVETDLLQFDRAVAESVRARDGGDATAEVEALERAVELWRGAPLDDLDNVDELAGEVENVRRRILDAALRLGELQLVSGRMDDALDLAERARAASPYAERAYRLSIACHLQRRDHEGLRSAVRSTMAMLDDLGVDPEPSTQMLLRRAGDVDSRSVV